MNKYTISPLYEKDIDAVTELERECFSVPWSRAMFLSELSNPNARYFTVFSGGMLAGYAGLHVICGEGHVTNIAVTPKVRRGGIGSELLRCLVFTAEEENLEFLTLEVRESNFPAIKLYEKFGFSELGRRRNYYENPREDALILTRFSPRTQ